VLDDDVSNGTLDLSSDGSFSYTPNANYSGEDTFTYKANDGIFESNIATVTIIVSEVNDPPFEPNNPVPDNRSTDIDINADISWEGGDPENDTVTYDIYFGTSSSPPKKVSNHSNTTYDPGTLDYLSTYYWIIIAWDDNGDSNTSDKWSFTTKKKSGGSPKNQNPIADASAGSPYFGFVEEEIIFNGSRSSDPDPEGYIVSWIWDYGDGTNGTGEITSHVYSMPGTYEASLTVTDDKDATDTTYIDVVISKANNPPSKPIIDGPTTGHKNTSYEFTALSFDEDNDTIQYLFNWGDGETTTTEFLPNGTSTLQTHNWAKYGEYLITISAFDNESESGTTEHTILIDILPIDGEIKGYFLDEDSDNVFDLFNNTDTGKQTRIERENNTYLIDINGDGKWDFTFNFNVGLLTYLNYLYQKYFQKMSQDTPGFEIISCLAILALVIFIKRRRK